MGGGHFNKGVCKNECTPPTSKSRNVGIGVISACCRTTSSHDEYSHPYVVDLILVSEMETWNLDPNSMECPSSNMSI